MGWKLKRKKEKKRKRKNGIKLTSKLCGDCKAVAGEKNYGRFEKKNRKEMNYEESGKPKPWVRSLFLLIVFIKIGVLVLRKRKDLFTMTNDQATNPNEYPKLNISNHN